MNKLKVYKHPYKEDCAAVVKNEELHVPPQSEVESFPGVSEVRKPPLVLVIH